MSCCKTISGLKRLEGRNFLSGFTLIELMLVVIIIGALAAMILPRLAGRSEQAKIAVAKTDVVANIPVALDMFEIDNGRYPTTEEGLKALVQQPGGLENWKGPYTKKNKFLDPWGKEYQYRCPSNHATDYDLFSFGPDGVQSGDDVNNWEE
ncbi:MAG: type II secretion system major pseudopilin GspG [bacterium]|nr:type II secretion system major pseudopilin GspG [bacterium]